MKYVKIVSESELKSRLAGSSGRLGAVPGAPRIVVSGNMASPWDVVRMVDESMPRYVFHALNCAKGVPERDGVTAETCFVGAGMRKHPDLRYVPSRLSMVPLMYSRNLPPDIVLLHCAPPRDGQISMGIEVNVLPAAVEACRARGGLVIAAINRHMPYTFGDSQIPVDWVDFGIEIDTPLASVKPGALDEDSRAIGQRVAAMVSDGATMQLGIGAVPDATLAELVTRKGLRVWTEMFSDGVLTLDEHGALDRDHPLSTSFIFGSQDLYAWLDGNRWVRMLRTEKTNDPGLIAQQRMMTSVNTALEVDLFGQANASRINSRIFSGFGGQTDFIVGALHANGGQSFIALRSWHPKADVSTIVPLVDEPVTSFQQSAIVTEQGVAPLFGWDQRMQAKQIIDNAAHPRVRAELWEEAGELGLV